jgi:hypothetical protein
LVPNTSASLKVTLITRVNLVEVQLLLEGKISNTEKTLIFRIGTRIIMESGLKLHTFINVHVSHIAVDFLTL